MLTMFLNDILFLKRSLLPVLTTIGSSVFVPDVLIMQISDCKPTEEEALPSVNWSYMVSACWPKSHLHTGNLPNLEHQLK